MSIRFSQRTAWDVGESSFTSASARVRAEGRTLIDLTVSNPTVCDFAYPGGEILTALQDARALTYDPDARGIAEAREAVVAYYRGHGAAVEAGAVVLTTSTSEAYSYLFRLMCDAGDEVLVAEPSYPLFDFLATLDDVKLRSYPLFYDFGWWIDFAVLESRISARTKAVLLVHPNNPTGHATSVAERRQLEELCRRHAIALIVDEVFLDYSLGEPARSFATGEQGCLKFVVSGLSKIAALPQMKVGWLVALGPRGEAEEALRRLEIVADTFLSLNAPAQLALQQWLTGSGQVRQQIVSRVRRNLAVLEEAKEVHYLPVRAGWSAVLEVPQRFGSAGLAERLIEEAGVVVHPGSFYAMAGNHRIVVSLIGPEQTFREGLMLIDRWCEAQREGD